MVRIPVQRCCKANGDCCSCCEVVTDCLTLMRSLMDNVDFAVGIQRNDGFKVMVTIARCRMNVEQTNLFVMLRFFCANAVAQMFGRQIKAGWIIQPYSLFITSELFRVLASLNDFCTLMYECPVSSPSSIFVVVQFAIVSLFSSYRY